MTSLPTEDDAVFPILLSYLRLVHEMLLLVPTALSINTTTSRDFACKVILVASYRFPLFRHNLLEQLAEVLPSRFHMDANLVDIIQFQTPKKSVCDRFDKLLTETLTETFSMERSQSRFLTSIIEGSHSNLSICQSTSSLS